MLAKMCASARRVAALSREQAEDAPPAYFDVCVRLLALSCELCSWLACWLPAAPYLDDPRDVGEEEEHPLLQRYALKRGRPGDPQ